jgi:O-antigen ligase
MTRTEALSRKDLALAVACSLFALVAGYAYVLLFTLNIKLIISVHLAVVLFFAAAVFAKDFKAFTLFGLVFLIPFGLSFHVIRHFFYLEQFEPFSWGVTIDLATILALLILSHRLLFSAFYKETNPITIGHPVGTLFLVWILYTLVAGALKAPDYEFTVYESFTLFKCFIVYFCLINYIKTEREVRIVIYALIAGMVVLGLDMVGQLITGLNYSITGFFVKPRADEVGIRASGLIGNDVQSTEMLSLVAPIAVAYYYALSPKKTFHRFVVILALLAILAGLIAAKGRAAGFATLVGMALVLVIGRFRHLIPRTKTVAAALIIVLCLLVMTPLIYQRFQEADRSWEVARVPLMDTALRMFEDNWVLGVGASNYGLLVDKYLPTAFRYAWKSPVHNEFLLLLAERGVIGTAIYYWMMIVISVWLWRSGRSPDRFLALISVGVVAGILGSVAIRIFHWYYSSPFFYYFCAVMALAVVLTRMSDSARRGIDTSVTSGIDSHEFGA